MAEVKKSLHPKVEEFKKFVKQHPKLVSEVRANKRTWQEIFEEWHILGEEDETWEAYKTENEASNTLQTTESERKKGDFMQQILSALQKVDMNEVQKHVGNLSGAISNIQSLISQFQSPGQRTNVNHSQHQANSNPFSFQKD